MKKALKSLFRKGEANVVKILCLGVGLAIGLTLLAEVIFQRSYDNFIPRLEDTYRVGERYMRPSDGGLKEYTQVSGMAAWDSRRIAPRWKPRPVSRNSLLMLLCRKTKKEVLCNIYMCDSSFFDVFPLPILMGEPPRTGLEKAGCGYISRELFEMLGQDIIGRTLTWKAFSEIPLHGGRGFRRHARKYAFAPFQRGAGFAYHRVGVVGRTKQLGGK